MVVPLINADVKMLGYEIPHYRTMLATHEATDEYWRTASSQPDFEASKGDNLHLVSGWCDFFVNDTISLYEQKVKSGDHPYLTVYNGDHFSFMVFKSFKQVKAWMDYKLKGDSSTLRQKPVALQLNPSGEWFYFDKWPLEISTKTLFLGKETGTIFSGVLLENEAQTDGVFSYKYNPEDPTPSFAGISLFHSGNLDNLQFLLDRQNNHKDSLTFVSAPTEYEYVIAGRPNVTLVVSSSLAYTDFYVKLLDYHSEKNESINISEGFVRISPSNQPVKSDDGFFEVNITLSPIFHKYAPNHQVMLQVASGAHPHYSRNPGTGEHISSATTFLSANQRVNAKLSKLSLPIYEHIPKTVCLDG
jgi:putative CocE/NonD family hydrolase